MPQKRVERAKNLITISMLESIAVERRLVAYLRAEKDETGVEIKAQIIRAAKAFYDVYAIGENQSSTKAEFEQALLDCSLELSSHLSRIELYGKNHPLMNDERVTIDEYLAGEDEDEDFVDETSEQRSTRIARSVNTLNIQD